MPFTTLTIRSLIVHSLIAQVAYATFDPAHLFPIDIVSGFSTAPSSSALPQDSKITRVTLDDKALGVTNITSGVTHAVVTAQNAPAGTMAWEADYPKGSYNPTGTPRGGFGFYLAGPSSFDFTSANEILFSYAVMFPAGFQFNMGGKLPGPYGGSTAALALGCSGGRQQDRDECFDLRLMWRTDGAGEIYAYLPEVLQNNETLLALEGTVIDETYGLSIARGAFSYAVGDWTVVAQRVKLNTIGSTGGNADGELELWVNGESVIHATDVIIRTSAASTFHGAHFQTFFGGSTVAWASPVAQSTFFADVSAAILAPNSSPASGKAAYPLAALAANSTSASGAGAKSGSGTAGSGSGGNGAARLASGAAALSLAALAAVVLAL